MTPEPMTGAAGGLLILASAAVKGGTAAIVSKYIDVVVRPFLNFISSSAAKKKIEQGLTRYLRMIELRTRCVPSIAIPSGEFLLEKIYEPLTLKGRLEGEFFTVKGFPRELLEQYRCISITDDAGMGKSTLAKYIVRAAVSESKQIPLLIELRRLRQGMQIVERLASELGGDAVAVSSEVIALMESGNFIFVLDGFDEVAEELRSDVIDQINNMSLRFPFCRFVLTSRKEYGSGAFPQFAEMQICRLTRDQAFALLRRYDQGGGIAEQLIQKISSAEVDEFLGNPLLVTLLFKAFDYRPTIPPKRSVFFRQVYEALFHDHDLSKGDGFERKKLSALDSDDMHKVLRALGFVSFQLGRVSYSKEELPELLADAIKRCALPTQVDVSKLKEDITKAVPILVRDGLEYRWVHKSFQEYFAAVYIVHDLASRKDEIIEKLFYSPEVVRFAEVLRFIAEADLSATRIVCAQALVRESSDGSSPPSVLDISQVDLIYFGELDPIDRTSSVFPELKKAAQDRFGKNLDFETCGFVINRDERFGVLSTLTLRGHRLLILSQMDPSLFEKQQTPNEYKALRVLRKHLGKSSVRIDQGFLKDLPPEVGEAASILARLPRFADHALQLIGEATEARSRAEAFAVLATF